MPFIATSAKTGERIDITAIARPREALTPGDLICQLCAAPMIIKAGLIVRSHFAHKTACTSPYQAHPESPEHQVGKYFIAEKVREELLLTYPGIAIEFEVPVPEANRVADVMVIFLNGWRIAHECQLASITQESILSGGSARAQIPRPIVSGVTITSVSHWQSSLLRPTVKVSRLEAWGGTWRTRSFLLDPTRFALRLDFSHFDSIANHVRHLAVRRSFEIWGRLSHADILRGLDADPGHRSLSAARLRRSGKRQQSW